MRLPRLLISTIPAVVLATTVATLAPSAQAGTNLPGPGYRAHDYAHGQAMSILPPGENGLVNATDLLAFEATKKRPAYSQDQLSKYENLLHGYSSLTNSSLDKYYDDESFGIRPGDVTKVERPGTGVTVYRDNHDVPHIYGKTDAAAAFGAGYAQAEDRLFLMDVLRHYGEGTLAQFMGSGCEFEQMDHDELLLAPYTKARAQQQIDKMENSFGPTGRLAKTMLDNYVAGVNAYINKTRLDVSKLPADYVAPIGLPQKWTDTDVVAVAGLIGGIFGRGGGSETADANLLQYLQHKYGAKAGRTAYTQINHQDDPTAPTTASGVRFPYDKATRPVDRSLTALPDPGKSLTGGPVDTTPKCAGGGSPIAGRTTASNKSRLLARNIVHALNAMPKHMSNALVVAGSHTDSGHPIAVFGPQVSYFAPQILSEEEIQSPHYSAEGASFPGTGLVELGRGRDYAWSATSAGSDLIDQRVEKICNPSGGAPDPQGKYYLFRGKCLPMVHETYKETVIPKLGGAGDIGTLSHEIYRTRHGVVQGWTTVGGKPVAIVNQRSTYDHDIDSIIGFVQFGEPGFVHDVHSWMVAASHIGFTFNWFYADNRDVGYYVSGRDPQRKPDVDTSLPTWGTGNAEWQGYLGRWQHVHQTNPKQGYFVSWNNKPAAGQADDGDYAYGQTYRSVLLVRQLKHQFALHHQKVTRAEVVKAMETAASQDLDGVTVMPLLEKYAARSGHSAGIEQMLRVLRAWSASGAHRRKATASATHYADHAAVAISDELMPNLIQGLYGRILGGQGLTGVSSTGGASTPGYATVPMQWVNTPNSGGSHLGSSYDGGYEGYLMSTLQQLLGGHPADGWSGVLTSHECNGGPSTCTAAINAALRKTYTALVKANGTSNVSSWTASTDSKAAGQTMPEYDAIAFRALGIVGQPNIEWQNRPTFQQVIQFPAHRPR